MRVLADEERQLDARTVAAESGKALGTVTFHFRNSGMWELRAAMAARGFQELGAALKRAAQRARRPKQVLRSMAQAYVRYALKNPELYRLMYSDPWDDEVQTAREAALGWTRQTLRDLQSAKIVRRGSIDSIDRSCTALIHGIAVLIIDGKLPKSASSSIVDESLTHLMEGIRPKK
jgi:hypothetical protein